MKVLIGCEESQTECLAFRSLGIEAYSCDIQPCSGGHPEWHIQDDVRNCWYGYDLLILHPPCTYLSNAGVNHLIRHGIINHDREELGQQAKRFFLECLDAPCNKICVENPSPSSYWGLPPCSQYIEPYMFGDPFLKRTLLWLRNLPLLMATDIVVPQYRYIGATNHCKGIRSYPMAGMKEKSSKYRSKSFPGVAYAMAAQWGMGLYY